MIEILIALAVFILALTAVALIAVSGATASRDIERARQAEASVDSTVAALNPVADWNFSSSSERRIQLAASYFSPCLAQVTVSEDFTFSAGTTTVSATTLMSNPAEAEAEGYACGDRVNANPRLVQVSLVPLLGSSTAVTYLGDTAYVGLSTAPYLAILEGSSTVRFTDNFALSAPPFDLVAVRWQAQGVWHAVLYAALATTSGQVATIDISSPAQATTTSVMTLRGVDPFGSFPQAWRLRYYDHRLYVATRETSGPELHLFNVSDYLHPQEIGQGTELGITVNDFVVDHSYLFAATDRINGELEAFAVASDTVREILSDRTDLPGSQNGSSIALLGPNLYVGRASVPSGPDLYVFDAGHPETSLPLHASVEIGSTVRQIVPSGAFASIATSKAGMQLQLWHMGSAWTLLQSVAFASIARSGISQDGLVVGSSSLGSFK